MKDFLRVALVLLLVLACTGIACRPRYVTTYPARTLTKVEYFKAKQANTTTTHGEIDLTSVKETADGVEYKTTDGKRWRVKMEKTPDGYSFAEPKPAE